jgi:nucleotide-binding universal stress UspA family protein
MGAKAMTQKIILAAIGQLPQDIAVLKRAIEVAAATGAKLHIVHVLDLPKGAGELDDMTTFLGQSAIAARDRIASALTELGEDTSKVEIQIELGSHAIVLIDFCTALSPDLIVMRAHQKKKLKDKILGSTTERVIAAGRNPVLVVKRAVSKPYSRVALGTDGTDAVLETSSLISGLLPDAQLRLVQVVQIPPQLKEEMLRVGTRAEDLAAYRKKLFKAAKNNLRDLAAQIERPVKIQLMKGDPAKSLMILCRKRNIDLIALGQGRANLVRRAFIGSVSRRLLRDASCDLLIWSHDRDVKD